MQDCCFLLNIINFVNMKLKVTLFTFLMWVAGLIDNSLLHIIPKNIIPKMIHYP